MSYLQEAFDQVLSEAIRPPEEGFYVCLMEDVPYYGGPEEGGWYGSDTVLRAYQHFATEEGAESARKAVEVLAKELGELSRREYGERCRAEMDWLEKRGLEADYLPEPDGASEFRVIVCSEIPENRCGCRHYE